MGLLIYIYRPGAFEPGDDLSDHFDRITVINIKGPVQASPDAPAFRLVAHHYYPEIPLLEPLDLAPFAGMRGPMAGSNYAGTSNSRWSEAVKRIAGNRACDIVKIYDHFEGGDK